MNRKCEWDVDEDCDEPAEFYVINKTAGVSFFFCRNHYYQYLSGLSQDKTTEDHLDIRQIKKGKLSRAIHIVPQRLKLNC